MNLETLRSVLPNRDHAELEAAGHVASLFAVITTILMVGSGQVTESNPGSGFLMSILGMDAWAYLTPLGIAGMFWFIRWSAGDPEQAGNRLTQFWKRNVTPAWARRAAFYSVTILTLDIIGNVSVIITRGLPETFRMGPLAGTSVGVAVVALFLYTRPHITSTLRHFIVRLSERDNLRALALALIILISVPTGGFGGYFSAVDNASAADGDLEWDFSLVSDNSGSSMVVTPDRVYTTGSAGDGPYWVAINRSDGTEVWNITTGLSGIAATPFLKDGTLYTSADGHAVALDAKDGSVIWNKSLTADGSGTVHGIAYDESTGKLAYAEETSGIYAVNPSDGSVDWSQTASKGSNQEPVIVNGSVYYVMRTNKLISREMSDGSLNWEATGFSSTPQSPALVSEKYGYVYVGTGDANELRAYHITNGSLDWSNPSGHYVRSSGSINNGILVYQDSGDELMGVHANNGTEIWSKTGNNVDDGASVTIVDGVAFVGTDSGVQKFDINDGSTISPEYGSARVGETPVVGGGKLHVVNNNAKVQKFDLGHDKTGNGLRSKLMIDGQTRGFGINPLSTSSGAGGGSASNPNTVVNQDGEPVPNATVEVWAVDYSQITPKNAQTKKERAQELLIDASNPLPPEWNPNAELGGDDGEWANAGGKYVGAYTGDDIGTAPWADSADLSPNLVHPEGEPVKFVVGDPTDSGGLVGGTDEYNRQVPGSVQKGDTVVVQQLGPDGTTTSSTTVQIDKTAGGGFADPSSLPYGETRLSAGVYSASVEGSPYTYTFTVGNPSAISKSIEANLTDEAGDLTDAAETIQQRVNDNKFKRITTTTDKNGEFSVSTGSNVKTVGIQAYKGPYNLIDTDPKNASLEDLRTLYTTKDTLSDGQLYNGSVVIPGEVKQTSPPVKGVTVETYEVRAPQYTDINRFGNISDLMDRLLQNESFADAVKSHLDLSDGNMTELRNRLYNVSQRNEELAQKYQELQDRVEERTGERPPNLPDDSTNLPDNHDDVEEQLRLLRQAVRETSGDIQPDEPTTEFGDDGTASATIPWTDDVDPEAVAVTAHFPGTGTSQPVADEYVSVNKRTGRGDVVNVQNYPVPNGTSMVTFGITVSGEDGEQVGDGKVSARNPDFEGRMLRLESLSVSTLAPGPDEQVRVSANPTEESARIDTMNATVETGGKSLNVTSVDSDTIRFTTDGAGPHYVTLEITDTAGNSWSEGLSIKANDRDTDHPPSVRARDGFTGRFAVVADGLKRGTMTTENGVARGTAIAPAGEVPGSVHFYTEQLSANYQQTDLQVMKQSGDGEPESVRKHLKAFVHTRKLSDNAVIYRNGNEPLEVGQETSAGAVTCGEDSPGCTIRTYTDGSGGVSLTVNNNPTVVESTLHWVRMRVPVQIPDITGMTGVGAPLHFQIPTTPLAASADLASPVTAPGELAAVSGGVSA